MASPMIFFLCYDDLSQGFGCYFGVKLFRVFMAAQTEAKHYVSYVLDAIKMSKHAAGHYVHCDDILGIEYLFGNPEYS